MTIGQREFRDYPRPSLAVDPAILTVRDGKLWTLLWRRQNPPQEGTWALPGVFVNERESLEAAVARGLLAKANVRDVMHIEQLLTWNKMNRDPRGWVVTVAYFALVPAAQLLEAVEGREHVGLFALDVKVGSIAGARVFRVDGKLIKPAFDHADILGAVVRRLRDKLWQSTVALALLPEKFTLREMQLVYEAILGEQLNKDSFRRRVMKTQRIIEPTGEFQENVGHRPPELFTGV